MLDSSTPAFTRLVQSSPDSVVAPTVASFHSDLMNLTLWLVRSENR